MHEGKQKSISIVLPGGKHGKQIVVILVGQCVSGGRFVRDWMCQCVAVRQNNRLRSCSRRYTIMLIGFVRRPEVFLDCVSDSG